MRNKILPPASHLMATTPRENARAAQRRRRRQQLLLAPVPYQSIFSGDEIIGISSARRSSNESKMMESKILSARDGEGRLKAE